MKVLLAPHTERQRLREQQTAFGVLTLFVLALLLVLHTLFAGVLGEPSNWVIGLLGIGFALKVGELVSLQNPSRLLLTDVITERQIVLSMAGVFLLTALLAYFTNRDDCPYFVLLAIPVLQAAYFLSLLATILAAAAADLMIVFWMWHFFRLHPPARPTEYMEAGMISVIYLLMGLLVWFLVDQLRAKQNDLRQSLKDLHATRELLVREEKLAAVGRLASGVAHEIRNPVAIISSALLTANNVLTSEQDRAEMFVIAARESQRLESLTSDFLTYARPAEPRRSSVLIGDLLTYIADVTSMRAGGKSIVLTTDFDPDVCAEIDSSLVEGALLNLTVNAVDAIQSSGEINVRATVLDQMLCIEVRNSGPAISVSATDHIFEPFFTTKSTGTGLGLAIVRGIARAHGGDVWVSSNQDGNVTFTMTLAHVSCASLTREVAHG